VPRIMLRTLVAASSAKTAGMACPVLYQVVRLGIRTFARIAIAMRQTKLSRQSEISSLANRKNRWLRFRDLNLRRTQAAMACVVPSSSAPARRTPISVWRAGKRGQIQGDACLPFRRPRIASTILHEIISCC
jgi:hypothetical protein